MSRLSTFSDSDKVRAARGLLRDAGISTPGGVAIFVGASVASSVVGAAALNLIYRTPWFLLVIFCLALLAIIWGIVVVRASRHGFDAPESTAPSSESVAPPIPEAHRQELQAIAKGMERYLRLERPVRYHPPGEDGTLILKESFRTHFPELSKELDDWNVFVELLDGCQTAMEDWISAEARRRGISYQGPVPSIVAVAAERENISNLTWSEAEGFLWVGGCAIVPVAPDDDREALKRPFESLLAAVPACTRARNLRAMRKRADALESDLLAALQRIQAKHVIRSRCDLCS